MLRPIRVLIIDDSEADSKLVINALKDGGFETAWQRVDTPEGLISALKDNEWDIAITDYIMPQFSAMDALNIIKERAKDLPVIVLSGMLAEEIAPDMIKAGADDFVTKNELPKLTAIVEREVKRVVHGLEEKVSNGENNYDQKVHAMRKTPFLSLKTRFTIVFSLIAVMITAYSAFIYSNELLEAEKTTFNKALMISSAITSAILDFSGGDKTFTGSSLDNIREYFKDLKNTQDYTIALLDLNGVTIAGYEISPGFSSMKEVTQGISKSADGGAPLHIKMKNNAGKYMRIFISKISALSGEAPVILAIDYTADYNNTVSAGSTQILLSMLLLGIVLIILIPAGYAAINAVVRPLEDIKKATVRLASGDLDTPLPVRKLDEIGQLACAFDLMRIHLKQNMKKMRAEIHERQLAEQALQSLHLKLTRWVSELDLRTHEITLLNQMGKMLQSCKTVDEFNVVTMRYAEQLFPEDHGAVYMFDETGKFMETVCTWGKEPIEHSFAPEECWGLRSGHLYSADMPDNPNMLCRHIKARGIDKSLILTICVPMMAQGETIGMFHIRYEQKPGIENKMNAKRKFAREQLVGAVAEHITLALSNLKLQDSLRQLSIHDPLTGLFNRRYMKDSLDRELYRAKRHNIPFGIIMLDIDYFKKFNDNYGHDVGDMVLERMGKIISNAIRPEDIACRYGGEEFLVILPGAGAEGAYQCAGRILNETRKLRIKTKGVVMSGVTVSLGIAAFPDNGTTADTLVKAADNALLTAKNSGRDCMVLSNETLITQEALQ